MTLVLSYCKCTIHPLTSPLSSRGMCLREKHLLFIATSYNPLSAPTALF